MNTAKLIRYLWLLPVCFVLAATWKEMRFMLHRKIAESLWRLGGSVFCFHCVRGLNRCTEAKNVSWEPHPVSPNPQGTHRRCSDFFQSKGSSKLTQLAFNPFRQTCVYKCFINYWLTVSCKQFCSSWHQRNNGCWSWFTMPLILCDLSCFSLQPRRQMLHVGEETPGGERSQRSSQSPGDSVGTCTSIPLLQIMGEMHVGFYSLLRVMSVLTHSENWNYIVIPQRAWLFHSFLTARPWRRLVQKFYANIHVMHCSEPY